MTLTRRLGSTWLALLLGASISVVLGSSPAQADPPVTVPDAVSIFAGNGAEANVLANDSDADGDELALCRLAPENYKKFELFVDAGVIFPVAAPNTKPGTYTFTYYACDFETLTPGTLTVTVLPTPDITVKAPAGQRGKIKVKNPADFKIRFLFGSFENESPDGIVKIAKHSSVVLTVRRRTIDWIAYSRTGEYLRTGHVRGIKLPPGTTAPAAGRVAPRVAKLWASAV